MLLIIGLGNPGIKYIGNRHNAGFIMLDKIRKELSFPEFSFEKKFNAEISEGPLPLSLRAERSNLEINNTKLEIAASPSAPRNDKLLLIKPQTFMNNSGEAAQKILSYYKLMPNDLIVIHDDLDIEIGNYKIATDSSSAGHNGVQNIIDKLGTQKFRRVRIGIGLPPHLTKSILQDDSKNQTDLNTNSTKHNSRCGGEDFVLQDFTEEEIKKIADIEPVILEDIKKIL